MLSVFVKQNSSLDVLQNISFSVTQNKFATTWRLIIMTDYFLEDNFLMIIRLLNPSFRAICKAKMDEVLAQSVVLASFNLRLPKPFRLHTKAVFSFYAEHHCLHNSFQWPPKHYIQREDMMSSPDRNWAHRKCDWGMWQAADGSFAPDNDSNRNTITIQLSVPLDFGHKGWLKMQT